MKIIFRHKSKIGVKFGRIDVLVNNTAIICNKLLSALTLAEWQKVIDVSLGSEVRVNSISPGLIDLSAERKRSEANQKAFSQADHLQLPAERIGNTDDIARLV
ncbi:MAG: SDR family NAD(P)-dependent oxidoreductase [Bacteroidia bacterium]|nr:SDR family NAD(P)-dependent oxidoreductase [Bacteroidia bacterium]